jgi:hypothetical protein
VGINQEGSPMDIELWVAALRVVTAVLAVSVVWPNLLDPRRWMRRMSIKADTRRAAQ